MYVDGGSPYFCVAYLGYDSSLTQTCNGDGCSQKSSDNAAWQNAAGDYLLSLDARKYGRATEKVTFDLVLPIPKDVGVDVASDNDLQFEHAGEFNGVRRVLDFSGELAEFLAGCTADQNGNCLVPISIKSGSAGTLQSSDLKIYFSPVDDTPPVTTDNSPQTWQNNDFTVTLNATDDIRGVAYTSYKIDSGEWVNGTLVSINTEGNHTIEYYSVDWAGNTESVKTTYAALDKTLPLVTFISPTPLNTILAQNYILINAITSENATAIALEWGGLNESMLGSEISWNRDKTNLTDGNYPFKVFATDAAGNIGVSEERWVAIDTTAPVEITNLNESSAASSSIAWQWANPAADFDHVEVMFNGVLRNNTTSNFTEFTGLNASTFYEILVRPVDGVGNAGIWANDSAETLAQPSSGDSGNPGGGGGGASAPITKEAENATASVKTTSQIATPRPTAAPTDNAQQEANNATISTGKETKGTSPTGFVSLIGNSSVLAAILGAVILGAIFLSYYFNPKTWSKNLKRAFQKSF